MNTLTGRGNPRSVTICQCILRWWERLAASVIIVLSLVSLESCAVYRLEPGAEPRVSGFGKVEVQPAEAGSLYKVTMPGLGLRTGYISSGFTLGWHESLVFCVEEGNIDQGVRCIADQGTSMGLDVSAGGLTLGYYRAFRVPLPEQGVSVIQTIHFSEQRPENTQIKRREYQ